MKICIVTETYPPEINGVAMTLHRIGYELRQQGHSVSIVRPRQSSEAQNAQYPDETILTGLPLPGYDGLRFGLPCRRKLRRLWESDSPDIIYVATEGPLGQSAIRAAEDLKIVIVSGFHTNFHKYMKHYKFPVLEKLVEGFLRKTHNRTRRTFAPSNDVIQHLAHMGVQNIRLLGRGVDTELFHPQKRDAALRQRWGIDGENGIVALFVSRLAAEKNIPLVIRAFERIKARQPQAACVLVGDGPERKKLEKSHPHFIYAGMQTGEALARHYASADLFVFPSVTETFGNVVTEAMASGLVPLAYDYAAPHRYIQSGQNGYLAAYDQDSAYLAALDRALDEAPNWNKLRTEARTTAEALCWSEIVQGFARELQDTLDEA
ncbi:MAG: glycosyltransferase involved in cell wall biosynthesis [Lentimonas sp.]|jgi:glycosyltransferase involved in cell wall biosynthesis